MPIIEVTFDPTKWTAGSGVGTSFGNNGYNAANVWLDKDGVTAWAFEYFGAGFARFNLSDGSIVHQDATFGVPGSGGQVWYTRESLGNFFQQDNSGNYYTILDNIPGPAQYPTLYKFQIGSGSAGNLLNGYCTNPTTFTLATMTPAPGNNQFEDARVFDSGGTTYVALIQEINPGVLYIINATTMTFVGSYTNTGHGRGWVVFQDNAGDIWGVFTDPNFSAQTIDLVKWHPADGATGGVLNFTTSGTGLHTVNTTTALPSPASFAFASYVPSNGSLWVGSNVSQTGPVCNIDLTGFTVTTFHLDDQTYYENGILDDAQNAMDNGVVNGLLAIPGDILSGGVPSPTQEGGIFHLTDPVSLSLLASSNISIAINSQGGLTPIPPQNIGGRGVSCLPPPGTFQWNGSQLVTAYEFIGSPVYIVPMLPTVTTQAASGITQTAATGNGNITDLGTGIANATLRGFVYDTVTHPLPGNVAPGSSGYAHNVTASGSFSTGAYTTAISGLTQATTYFARAVVQTGVGYAYGSEVSFTTLAPATLNSATPVLVSSLAPSHFEDEVTFTCTVSDPITGDPNPNTAPLGTVLFVADGSFGFGSEPLTPLTAAITQVQASLTVATYTAPNTFTAGQKVTITGYLGSFTQFNQTNVVIATATSSSFTINGSYTVQAQATASGTATSTSASSCAASTTVLISGLHTIQAQYLGDATPITGHSPANSNILTQQVVAVNTVNTVEFPGFALIASFTTAGDEGLVAQAQLGAVPSATHAHVSINLIWVTLNVAFVRITGSNGVDYLPFGFDTGLISTSGSGIYVIGNGFTSNITLTLQAYDASQNPLAGVTSSVHITIS